jgi:micrococcal nuclease
MKHIVFSLLFLLLAVPVWAKEPLRTFEAMVERIVDGDTIAVVEKNGGGARLKIRLYGIDAPEDEKINKKTGKISKAGQPYGNEATKILEAKVSNAVVIINVMDVDRYKRLVGVVRIGNRNINREMVTEGYAWAYKQYLSTPYKSEFIEAEELARSKRLGLWKDDNPQPPWEFRRLQRIRD